MGAVSGVSNIIEGIGSALGGFLPTTPLVSGIIVLALGLIVLVALILAVVFIIKGVKKKKNKKQAEKTALSKPIEEVAPTQAVKFEPVKTPNVDKVKKASSSAKPKAEKVEKTVKKLNGKWIIVKKKQGEYASELLASNGEVMLTSEIYTTPEGAKSGIETIIKGVFEGNFIIYKDKSENHYYKLKTASNRLLCVGEIYKSEDQCCKAIETVKRIAKDSPIVEKVQEESTFVDYTPVELDLDAIMKGLKGKWKIEKNGQKYCAKLYASNGQLMLATEEVSKKGNAVNAIETVAKNAKEGNFIIDKDKFGRYYYKLRNAQKSVICIGEGYESLDSCINALESVRRFAINSTKVSE